MMSRIEKRNLAILGAARRGLDRAFELSPAARAARIEAYRLQVALTPPMLQTGRLRFGRLRWNGRYFWFIRFLHSFRQALWIHRFMANGNLKYTEPAAAEDRGTLGSDLSAAAAAIRHGRHPIRMPPALHCAGGPNALNPHFQRPNAVSPSSQGQLCFPRMNLILGSSD